MARKIKKCLMIETPDKKKFFTFEKNYTEILDFANSFNCEISTVKLEEGQILDLVPLAKAITCKETAQRAKFQLLKTMKERRYNRRRR
jgi:hypothetical protein